MTFEMDLLRMDERQRLAWLMANRGTLITVGAAWIGLIVWELAHQRSPLLLVLVVPLVAMVRAGLFAYYCSISVDLESPARPRRATRLVKMAAAVLLLGSLLAPLYSLPGDPPHPSDRRYGHVWDFVADDPYAILPLVVAYLWPVLTLGLSRSAPGKRRLSRLVPLVEPFLVALSVLILLWIPQFVWEMQTLWFFPLGFITALPAAGCYLAVIANGLYFTSWLSEALHP